MTDERSQAEGGSIGSKSEVYLRLAQELAGPVCQGRTGFGAFRRLQQILQNSVELVGESGLFAHPSKISWPYFPVRHGLAAYHRFFFERVLGSPVNYNPPAFWALFWALAKAEHQFLFRYTPFWSHEERLTGHLVSQVMERVEEFAAHWRSLGSAGSDPAHCRIWYADTATARREKFTGADFGLVVHAKLPQIPEFFKVARFQAKKAAANGSAVIDLDQVEALTKTENLGYYLFYHRFDPKRWSPAPTVQAASNFSDSSSSEKNRANKITANAHDGWDFSAFVTFGIADPAAEHGVLTEDASDAARVLMSAGGSAPSRILVLTLGGGESVVDWNQVFREYLGFQGDD